MSARHTQQLSSLRDTHRLHQSVQARELKVSSILVWEGRIGIGETWVSILARSYVALNIRNAID